MKTSCDIHQLLQFLAELAAHNERPWFKAHKDRWDALRLAWEQDIQRLITLVAEYDPQARGLTVRDAAYRIYRDIRFSPDKSPYKTWTGAVIGRGGRHAIQSCYYVHFQPDHLMLGGGIWWPATDILQRLRRLIDAEPDEWLAIVNHPDITRHFRWECNTLKTMPRGYDRDHPLAEFIKMKEYILVRPLDESYFDCDDWVQRMADDLRPLKPMHDFLNYVFEQE